MQQCEEYPRPMRVSHLPSLRFVVPTSHNGTHISRAPPPTLATAASTSILPIITRSCSTRARSTIPSTFLHNRLNSPRSQCSQRIAGHIDPYATSDTPPPTPSTPSQLPTMPPAPRAGTPYPFGLHSPCAAHKSETDPHIEQRLISGWKAIEAKGPRQSQTILILLIHNPLLNDDIALVFDDVMPVKNMAIVPSIIVIILVLYADWTPPDTALTNVTNNGSTPSPQTVGD
ncbi:hypothetical protein SERLA73DRAFT_75929 [Serpula lacrymans var. lacrymans S7.3]|uniref:Uncharacterized protein n=2 Tax=Serpula lacrymans var. lacrymans TaxID=341189 RepID=F8Q5N8_SERL3|nr:uncharacterized protein SERLADRAFT_440702 [Serpula lacrymans var. lacrymans S7.9]XP_007321232.1 uncharacterized protein SERLADRAFT_440704 [Serpula lacrymans var. lacrymans S7.9]EGN95926.1 hypothetical protein SERLA73DRAFT_75929 [Serpula lacrymans var. lacrymans S7.3]EGO21445.1 hypothetical protein SERLADRAFT_440702 [Serpula lacrymans var. lacrymans S7.9]EGO21446.1 hypothetical protein SERLADRAFT_440704 [Serpula lacrymans var. lacrymans S7.9]